MINKLSAGDTLSFEQAVIDAQGNRYTPADGWSMDLLLVPRTAGTGITVAASAAAGNQAFDVEASADTTEDWATGIYTAFAVVSSGSDRKTVELGTLEVLADPSEATSYDSRTDAQRTLEALRDALKSYATNGQGHVAEYEIAGRRMKFRSSAEIIEQIRYWERVVADETVAARVASGQASGRKVYTRFVS